MFTTIELLLHQSCLTSIERRKGCSVLCRRKVETVMIWTGDTSPTVDLFLWKQSSLKVSTYASGYSVDRSLIAYLQSVGNDVSSLGTAELYGSYQRLEVSHP